MLRSCLKKIGEDGLRKKHNINLGHLHTGRQADRHKHPLEVLKKNSATHSVTTRGQDWPTLCALKGLQSQVVKDGSGGMGSGRLGGNVEIPDFTPAKCGRAGM